MTRMGLGGRQGVRMMLLFLLAVASLGLFFIASYVDRLHHNTRHRHDHRDHRGPLQGSTPGAGDAREQGAVASDSAVVEPEVKDDIADFGSRVTSLLRDLSRPDVDRAVLDGHCDEADPTEDDSDSDSDQLSTERKTERLGCYGRLLMDYGLEVATLGSLDLLPEERITSALGPILEYLEKQRKPPPKLDQRERERRLRRLNVYEIAAGTPREEVPAWVQFQNRINRQALYLDDDAELINNLTRDLSIFAVDEIDDIPDRGTQIKLVLLLADGSQALFKPKRVEREEHENLDTYYMYEKERHTSEIAAFHLSRVMGFNSVPPVVGRYFNMTEELYPYLVDSIQDHFFTSPGGNTCFFGQCEYFCDAGHAVCGRGDILEGSMAAFLPDREMADWKSIKHPWKRSYSKYNRSEWETTDDPTGYCASVRRTPPFHKDRAILNVIDASIFDFLMGNKDRHHFYHFVRFGNDSYYILIDNGKGFGRPHADIVDILAPLYQCCLIRYTTLRRLYAFHGRPERRLSRLMRDSLASDPLASVLTPDHLRALDRRVRIVLQQVLSCIERKSPEQSVIIDDKYYFERE